MHEGDDRLWSAGIDVIDNSNSRNVNRHKRITEIHSSDWSDGLWELGGVRQVSRGGGQQNSRDHD